MTKKLTPTEAVSIELLEIFEIVGIPATIGQARKVADEMLSRWPALTTAATRKPWKRWSDEEREAVRRMYIDGMTIGQIMKVTDRTRGQINGLLTRLNISRK